MKNTKKQVEEFVTGEVTYDSKKARSLVVPVKVKKQWDMFCDFMEDPLSNIPKNKMSVKQINQLNESPYFKNKIGDQLVDWSFDK